jgi:GNAT superfamily N-acetyltransferase
MPRIEGLRDFRAPEDYALLTEIYGVILPEYPEMGENLRQEDEDTRPPARVKRWIVEREGRAIACADYHQYTSMHHPRKFFVDVVVLPEHQRRGLGGALFEFVLEQLAEFDPWILRVEAREDITASTEQLNKRGYRPVQRYEEWRLDLSEWKPEDWSAEFEKALAGGLQVTSLAELAGDPDLRQHFYELREPLVDDVPHVDARTGLSFENFQKHVFDKPTYRAEGIFIGILDGKWIGASELWAGVGSDPNLWVGLTGVLPGHRGKGIASALKIAALNWAKASGAPFAITWVEEANRPMMGINTRMGFKPRPAWVTWEKEVGEPDPA